MTRRDDALTAAERTTLWSQVDHAVADARAGHRHVVPVGHDALRRLLRAHDRWHDRSRDTRPTPAVTRTQVDTYNSGAR